MKEEKIHFFNQWFIDLRFNYFRHVSISKIYSGGNTAGYRSVNNGGLFQKLLLKKDSSSAFNRMVLEITTTFSLVRPRSLF